MILEEFRKFIERSNLGLEDKALWRSAFNKIPKKWIETLAEYVAESEHKLKEVTANIRLKKRALETNDEQLMEKALKDEKFTIN